MVVKRMDWIDIAKGILIILMIVGHTASYGSKLYAFIYSFHMPLFIILSGITHKQAKNEKEIIINIKKYVKRLFIPYVITLIISSIIHTLINTNTLSISIIIRKLFIDFIWGNGCNYLFLGKKFLNIGPCWFLITLFLSKILFDFINLLVKEETKRSIIYIFLLTIMIPFSICNRLPWGIDMIFVFTFFLYIGHLLSIHKDFLKIHFKKIFIFSLIFWVICLSYNMHIELAIRKYPLGFISIIESLCSSYCIIVLFQYLEKSNIIKKIFIPIGKLSLLILCIHSIENSFINWEIIPISNLFIILIRIIFVISLAIILVVSKKMLLEKTNN